MGTLPGTLPLRSQQEGVWRGRPAAAQPPLRHSQAEQFLPGPTVKAQDSTCAEKPSGTHHGRTHPSFTKRSTDKRGYKAVGTNQMATQKTCTPTGQTDRQTMRSPLWVKSPGDAALASTLGNKGTRVLQSAILQYQKLTK